MDIRLVNTTTGEIVLAETAEGKGTSTSVAVRFEDIDFGNPTYWDQTLLGKAARESVEKCVKHIDKAMEGIPWQGKIIKANDDGTVYMKPGSEGGVKAGMEFVVYSKGEALIDPDTGISLGSEEILVSTESMEGLAVAADKLVTVAIDTTLTPELIAEGLAREIFGKNV